MGNLDEMSFNENDSNIASENTYSIDTSWFKDTEPKEVSGDDFKQIDDIESFEDKIVSEFDEPQKIHETHDFAPSLMWGVDYSYDDDDKLPSDDEIISEKQEQNISDLFIDENKRANDASMFLLNEPVLNEEPSRTTIDNLIKNLQFTVDDELNKGLILFESFDRYEFTNDEQYEDVSTHIRQSIVEFIREINKRREAFLAGNEFMSKTMLLRQKKETILEIISRLMVKYDISINYLRERLPYTQYTDKDLDTLDALTSKLRGTQGR